MANVSELLKVYGLGRQTYRRLFDSHDRIIVLKTEISPADKARLEACEASWIRSQVLQKVKPLEKEDRLAILKAMEEGDREAVRFLRRAVARRRAAFREDLRKKGGIIAGINNHAVPRDAAKARSMFLICAGAMELADKKLRSEGVRQLSASAANIPTPSPSSVVAEVPAS